MVRPRSTRVDHRATQALDDPRLPQWLRELATLLESGIPAADAFHKSSLMQLPAGRRMAQMLNDGQSISAAFGRGLFLHAADRVLLKAAEAGGFVPTVFKQLATRAEQRAARVRKMRVRWHLLTAILVIGWVAGFLLACFSTTQSVLSALIGNTLICALVFWLMRCINGLMCKDSWWWLNTLARFGRFHAQTAQNLMAAHWLRLLSQQISAGLDAATAMDNMVGLLSYAPVQASVRAASEMVAEGNTLRDALMSAHLLSAAKITGQLLAGEYSGSLEASLTRVADDAEAQLQSLLQELQDWIPRLLYVIVVFFAISVIL